VSEEVLRPAKHRSGPKFYDFGPYRVDAAKGVLLRDGEPVPLPPKAFETLLRLLQENGQVVTKAELMAAVWPDTFVEENNLNQCVSILRRALGSTSDGTPRVETIPRRGYRFVGPVIGHDGEESPRPRGAPAGPGPPASGGVSRSRVRLGGAMALAAILAVLGSAALLLRRSPAPPPIRSLAVLPFENLSGNAQEDYFAEGFTDTLTTNLARIRSLRVISRMSAMHYKGSRQTAPAIARELGVDALIEGTVLHDGNRVRVTAQLVRGDSDSHAWADSYEREMKDVLELQNEVARSIAREVQVKLTSQEHAVLTAARQVDPEAYELYLKGRYFWNKRTRQTISKAVEYFQRAIDRDPGYAVAYSGLADCHSSSGFSYDLAAAAPIDAFTKAKAAAAKALAIDDQLPDVHNSLGFIRLTYDWDLAGAEAEFKRALELDADLANAHHWYAHYLIATGRSDRALVESRRALELDPLNPILNTHLGWHYVMAHDYDRAIAQLLKTLDLDPDYGLARWYMGLAYEQRRMYPEAIEQLKRADDLLGRHLAVEGDLAHVYAVSNDEAAARRALEDLQEVSRERYVSAFEIALVYLGLRRKDEGFAWLDRAYRERADLLVYLKVDPRLDPVRDDPRFGDLLRRVGLPR
jgi:TolB-like protein/DNA-binding winged helix-turn-helix (wHTH) protein/Tfp pilus assembly protein PilF